MLSGQVRRQTLCGPLNRANLSPNGFGFSVGAGIISTRVPSGRAPSSSMRTSAVMLNPRNQNLIHIIAADAVLCQQFYASFAAPARARPGRELWVAARDGIRDNSPSYSAEKSPAVLANANGERESLEAETRQTNIETSPPA